MTSVLAKFVGSYCRSKHLRTITQRCHLTTTSVLKYKREPDDLKVEVEIPEYPTININLHGYDFPVLDAFSSYAHKTASNMGLDCELMPVPAMKQQIQSFKVNTKIQVEAFKLNSYHRRLQIHDLQSTQLPLLLEMLRQGTPQGVNVNIKENTDDDDEFLYVPDYEKEKLLQEIDDLDQL